MKKMVYILTVSFIVLWTGSLQAAVVAYEPFYYYPTDASIDGSHLGTANPDWVHMWGVYQVLNTGLTYGSLSVSGASVRKDLYGDPVINTGRKHPGYQNTAMNADIAAAGLLADGATLWASILIDTPSSITNSGAYFTIGTHHINHDGKARNLATYASETGDAVGLKISNTTFQSASWQNQNAGTYGTLQTMPAGTHLYVMEMVWGATTDTINFYLPGTDLTLGTAVGSINVSVNNANFAAVSLSSIGGDPYIFDEIRFGSTFNDVVGIIDPTLATVHGVSDWATWSDETVIFDNVTVVNNDLGAGGLTMQWTAVAPAGVTVTIVGETTAQPQITVTKPLDDTMALVECKLTVSQNGKEDVSVKMWIQVYDDACKAALGTGNHTIRQADFNGDCITDLDDLYELVYDWMLDFTLTGPANR